MKQTKLKTICRQKFLMQNNNALWEHTPPQEINSDWDVQIFLLIIPCFCVSVCYLILWCLITCPLGKKNLFSEKKAPKHTKAPTFSWFYLFLKDFIWGQVQPYVVAASKSVNFPHIYTSLHYYFIIKLCLTLTWLPQDLTADQRSFCYICESTLFQTSSGLLLGAWKLARLSILWSFVLSEIIFSTLLKTSQTRHETTLSLMLM